MERIEEKGRRKRTKNKERMKNGRREEERKIDRDNYGFLLIDSFTLIILFFNS